MKISIDKTLQQYLEEFDLNEREILIYITLLRTGPNTIMNLARETGVKRSTTHNNVEELIKKGLVSQTNYGERRMVVAEDPEKLKFLLEQKKWNVKKVEENLPSVIEMINKMVPDAKENTEVEVKYYEGKKEALYVYREAFESKELRSYVNLSEVSKVFPENSEAFIEVQKTHKDMKVFEIIDPSSDSLAIAKKFKEFGNFDYRVTDKSMNLTALDILIYSNKVAMVNFKESIKVTVISNKDYYENSKAIFDYIWQTIK